MRTQDTGLTTADGGSSALHTSPSCDGLACRTHGHGRATEPRVGRPRVRRHRVGLSTGTAGPPNPGSEDHEFGATGPDYPRARPGHRTPSRKTTSSAQPGRAIHGHGRATEPQVGRPRVRRNRAGLSTGTAGPPNPGSEDHEFGATGPGYPR